MRITKARNYENTKENKNGHPLCLFRGFVLSCFRDCLWEPQAAAARIMSYHHLTHWLGLVLLLPATGCHRYLVATPNVLRDSDAQKVYADCPADCKTLEAPVIYATDRSGSAPLYGYGRETSLAFGVANVRLGAHATWTELIQDTTR